jgi:polysaccharide lyase-like protein/Big-like domain-containing protein
MFFLDAWTQRVGARGALRRQAESLLCGIALTLVFAGAAQARSVEITAPRAGSTVSGSIPFKATAKGSPRSVSFYLDGKRRSTDRSRPYSAGRRIDTSRLSRGVHHLTVEARYRRGKRRSASLRLQVVRAGYAQTTSGTSSGVTWKAPTAGQTVKGVLSGRLCEVSVSNERYLRQLRFYVDDREFDRESKAPYNCSWDTRTVSDGAHTLKVVGYDTAGAQSTASLGVNVANKSVVVTPPASPPPASTPPPSSTSPGSALWRADFETGDFSQWEGVQQFTPERASVVSSPHVEGGFAGRFEVREGEFIGADAATRNRTEALLSTAKSRHAPKEGDDWWYRWWFYLPASTPIPANGSTNFMIITQWPSTAPPSSLDFELNGVLQLRDIKASGGPGPGGTELNYSDGGSRSDGKEYMWRKPASSVTRDSWHKLLVHKKWSSSESVGFVEIWYEDVQQTLTDGTARMHMRTLRPGYSAYMKQGLYRSNAIGGTGVVFHDGLRIGTTRAAVDS